MTRPAWLLLILIALVTLAGCGLADEGAAVRLAEELAAEPGAAPLEVERVTYVAFTHREVVNVITDPPAAVDVPTD